jgi:AcrR family transcriptional regulator
MSPARSDAMRNRAAILAAAEQLVARDGPERVRIAEVARRAGVGPGSVYRAFESKSALLLALLDERERLLQEEILRGDPPLGPGARADERLIAFVLALHELTVHQRRVLAAAEEGSLLARHRTGAHRAWRLHVTLLLRELRPDADADVLAEFLLAPLAASVYVHLIDDRTVAPRRIRAELERLASLVARPGRPTPARRDPQPASGEGAS